MKDILAEWIQQGIKLQIDEELYIPTSHKNEQKDFFKELRDKLKEYRQIDPIAGSQLRLYMTYKDKQYWVVMKKTATTPLIGYRKGADGKVTKVTLVNTELERIEKLKRQENLE